MNQTGRHSKISRIKFFLFACIPAVIGGVIVGGIWKWLDDSEARAKGLSGQVWETTYIERGLAVPPGGPRVGFSGERAWPKVAHRELGWIEPPAQIPGVLEVNIDGLQRYQPRMKPQFRLLIVGGSVAYATFASKIESTYFYHLGQYLEQEKSPTDIAIFATGAWKSSQDIKAFEIFVNRFGKPNLVVFINGLNDLTNGANANVVHGMVTKTLDGSRWTAEYHEHDFDQRVAVYLEKMKKAATFADGHEIKMFVVLQPALFLKTPRSKLEQQLLEATPIWRDAGDVLARAYATMRSGLRDLADAEGFDMLDATRPFQGESRTTFTDVWHFSDAGHQMFADVVSPAVYNVLNDD